MYDKNVYILRYGKCISTEPAESITFVPRHEKTNNVVS